MATPSPVTPTSRLFDISLKGAITRDVTTNQETINAEIEKMELPFETELKKYVKADESIVNSITTNIKTLLDALKDLTVAKATLLLDPSQYTTGYTSTLLTNLEAKLVTNLAASDLGFSTTVEQAMYDRARARIREAANRQHRRISAELAKMVPYQGAIGDWILESDRDLINRENDINNDVLVKQGEWTYRMARDKINESISHLRGVIQDHQATKEIAIRAYTNYDELNVRQQWLEFDFKLKRALGYCREAIDFTLKAASGANQITFENWLKMSKILGEAQLQISALIGDLLPGSQSV